MRLGRALLEAALLLVAGLLLVGSSVGGASALYTPAPGDSFSYSENIALGGGAGNYSGYTENTVTNGSISVAAVASNGTETAHFYNANAWQNNEGQSQSYTSSGSFTFSARTFLYVNGSDNQTGYVDPYVWFFMNNSLPVGGSFFILNSPMSVVGTAYDYTLQTTAGTYVQTIFTEGNGTYQRNDDYGVFTASYNWQAYYDPATGYMVGYVYTEQDTDPAGDGFALTDTLQVTHTSYALTADGAPPPPTSSGPSSSELLLIAVAVVVVIVIVVAIALAASRSRRGRPLPRHSGPGMVQYAPPPGMAPPPIGLRPGGQPSVQQIVVRETVKVNCKYCGNLIDTTVDKCPFCGAART